MPTYQPVRVSISTPPTTGNCRVFEVSGSTSTLIAQNVPLTSLTGSGIVYNVDSGYTKVRVVPDNACDISASIASTTTTSTTTTTTSTTSTTSTTTTTTTLPKTYINWYYRAEAESTFTIRSGSTYFVNLGSGLIPVDGYYEASGMFTASLGSNITASVTSTVSSLYMNQIEAYLKNEFGSILTSSINSNPGVTSAVRVYLTSSISGQFSLEGYAFGYAT